MLKISRPFGERGNMGIDAFICTIQSSIHTDALFRCVSTDYFKTKRMDQCKKIIRA